MAIAFDAASTGTKNSVTLTALTVSHTCTGSDLILWVGCAANSGDYISTGTVTYNGVSMTQAVKQVASGTNYTYLYYLINPATGAHNIVITPGTATALELCAASYTGAKQSGQPDNTTSGSNSSTTSITTTLTTVADNCWTVAFGGIQRAMTASTGMTARGSAGGTWGTIIGDSNSAITPAGSYSMTMTFSSVAAGNQSAVMASFSPVSAAVAVRRTLTLLGVA